MARLMELMLVELLRSRNVGGSEKQAGLLAGQADPVTACALTAMHRDVAHGWTVAGLCGVSRSSFASRFRARTGTGPIEYLQQWRRALARDELRRGTRSIGEITPADGFQSSSAFSTAFTRVAGCSPTRFAIQTSRKVSETSRSRPQTDPATSYPAWK